MNITKRCVDGCQYLTNKENKAFCTKKNTSINKGNFCKEFSTKPNLTLYWILVILAYLNLVITIFFY